MAGGGGACQHDPEALIVLARHPAALVAPGVCYGRLDVPPGDSAGLVRALAGYRGIVWSSPARRCLAVAEGLGAHRVDSRLQELDFGAWEGVAWDAIPRAALDAWAGDLLGFAPPGGESGAALIARVAAFVADLPAGDHVVISHGGPLRVLPAILRGEMPDLAVAAPGLGAVMVVGGP